MSKRNWQCKDCGLFHWGVARQATGKELKQAQEFIDCDEDIECYDYPKNENDWSIAVLYCGENQFEMSEASDNCLEDFCEKCQKKLIKYGVFEKEEELQGELL